MNNHCQFSKPRIRELGVMAFRCEIHWWFNDRSYFSIGENLTAKRAWMDAFRPLVDDRWLQYLPKAWVPTELVPTWRTQCLDRLEANPR